MKKYKYIIFPALFVSVFVIFFITYNSFIKSKQNSLLPISNNSFNKSASFEQLCKDYPRMYNKNNSEVNTTIVSSDKYGYIATDRYSITHRYDNNSKRFIPITPPEIYDRTQKARIVNILNRLFSSKLNIVVNNINTEAPNPAKLDQADIDSYIKTNTDTNLKSFKFIYNSKKEPVLIVAINTIPKNEIDTMLETLQNAVGILEKYDPNILNKISTEYFLRVITGPITGEEIKTNKSVAVSDIGAIQYNARLVKSDYQYYIYSLIFHSRYIGNYKSSELASNNAYRYYLKDNLDTDPITDQLLWTKTWVTSHKNDIFKNDYEDLINLIDSQIKK